MRPTVAEGRADIAVGPVRDGRATITVTMDPRDAADHARWFHVLGWQGAGDGDGGLELVDLRRTGEGTYVSERPVPVTGEWKTLLRLHAGSGMSGAAVYLPEDPAIPAEEVPARDGTVTFGREKSILQREATGGTPSLERGAYVVLALIGATWLACMAWGLRRLDDRRDGPHPATTVTRSVASSPVSPGTAHT
jgi:hypothetical protein